MFSFLFVLFFFFSFPCLWGVGLGTGDSDLGAGVDVDSAVGLPADGGPHRVRDAHNQGAAGLAISDNKKSCLIYILEIDLWLLAR